MTLLAVVGRPDVVDPMAADDPWYPFLLAWAHRWGSDFRNLDPAALSPEQRKWRDDHLRRLAPPATRDEAPAADVVAARLAGLDPRCRQYVAERFRDRWRMALTHTGPHTWSVAQRRDVPAWADRAEVLAAKVNAHGETA